MNPRESLERLSRWIDSLSLRERGLILLMVLAILYLLWDFALMSPLDKAQKARQQQVASLQQRTSAMHQGIRELLDKQSSSADAAQQRIAQLEQAVKAVDAKLDNATSGLVRPKQMPALLRDMLRSERHLKLVSLKTLPTVSLVNPDTLKDGKAVLYRHGLEITLEGRYQSILDYVTRLESQHWHFYWKSFALKSQDYPTNKVTLVIYTLGLDKEVLGV